MQLKHFRAILGCVLISPPAVAVLSAHARIPREGAQTFQKTRCHQAAESELKMACAQLRMAIFVPKRIFKKTAHASRIFRGQPRPRKPPAVAVLHTYNEMPRGGGTGKPRKNQIATGDRI
jgi:hypothetical protein